MSDATHLRGVRVAETDTGRVVRILVALGLVGLAVLTLVLAVGAAGQNSRSEQIRQRGVPVMATVTGCLGVGSGVGMGIEYWQCRGAYTLDGQRHEAVIGGSRTHLPDGQQVAAVAVPGNPALLTAAGAVAQGGSSVTAYVAPIALGAATVAGTLVAVVWFRRSRAAGAG